MLMTAGGRLERVAEAYEAEEYTYFLDDIDLDSSALRAQVASVLTTRRVRESDGPIFWGRSRPCSGSGPDSPCSPGRGCR